MQKYNRILFIGFRCTGKTTIGSAFAKKYNMPFFDMDIEIEKEQGKSIKEIANNGKNWEKFRELELLKAKELLSKDNIVISAGGGLGVNNIEDFGMRQRELVIKSQDTLKVWLYSREKIIAKYLLESYQKENNRPDLNGRSQSAEEYVENNIKMMYSRKENYEKMANIKIDTSNFDIDNILNKIFEKYEV